MDAINERNALSKARTMMTDAGLIRAATACQKHYARTGEYEAWVQAWEWAQAYALRVMGQHRKDVDDGC